MGLAASQARLLTITARKADCEFESMKLSHQKIALSRDMERISDEYQAAMGKTKLIYDYYGTGTSDMALTYGLLMTPSIYNDYYPRLITDRANRVVLTGAYAAAAKAAGIPAEGYNGTPSSEVRNRFVEALTDAGVIDSLTAANIESVSYNNSVGLGATFSATAATQDITYDDLLNLIKAKCVDTKDYDEKTIMLGGDNELSKTSQYPLVAYITAAEDNDYPTGMHLWKGSNATDVTSVTLYELLNGSEDYLYELISTRGVRIPITEAAFMQQMLVGTENSPSFLNWMTDQFSSILGGVVENDLALQYAYNQVYDLIYPNESIQDVSMRMLNGYSLQDGMWRGNDYNHDGDSRSDFKDAGNDWADQTRPAIDTAATKTRDSKSSNDENVWEEALHYIGMVWGGHVGNYKNMTGSVAVDLSTLAKVFLTAFIEYQNGIDNSKYSYNLGQTDNGMNGTTICNLYEAKDIDKFKIKAPTDVTDGSDDLVAGFYDSLFNRICMSGWTQNDNIETIEYMHELLKTGAIYISSISNDGNYYQSSYSTDTYISEVADTEGIAQAEAKYNAAKVKIEHKENTLDVKMKNLDTEISSLTTEYDTMKNLISKTIEKSFKRYDA